MLLEDPMLPRKVKYLSGSSGVTCQVRTRMLRRTLAGKAGCVKDLEWKRPTCGRR